MSRSIIIIKDAVSDRKDRKDIRNFRNSKNNKSSKVPKKFAKLKSSYKILFFLMCLMVFFLSLLKYAEIKLHPVVSSMAAQHARNIGTMVISKAIEEEIESCSVLYNDIISFEKDNDGGITALKTDIIMVNRLKSRLSIVILEKLSEINVMSLYIPIGNFVSGGFLSGRGPKLEVRILPVGSVSTDISNIFTSAGINQTRHQVMLDVRVTLTADVPLSAEFIDISTSVCIAETVIIGDVPNVYFN